MTLRQYKKKYFICKDDNGKMIYAGDTLELHIPSESVKPYQSVVFWSRVDGGYVETHPAHVVENDGKMYHRNLRDFLGKKQSVPKNCFGDEKLVFAYTKCVKVKNFYET